MKDFSLMGTRLRHVHMTNLLILIYIHLIIFQAKKILSRSEAIFQRPCNELLELIRELWYRLPRMFCGQGKNRRERISRRRFFR
jgi:hypothetical protein